MLLDPKADDTPLAPLKKNPGPEIVFSLPPHVTIRGGGRKKKISCLSSSRDRTVKRLRGKVCL